MKGKAKMNATIKKVNQIKIIRKNTFIYLNRMIIVWWIECRIPYDEGR